MKLDEIAPVEFIEIEPIRLDKRCGACNGPIFIKDSTGKDAKVYTDKAGHGPVCPICFKLVRTFEQLAAKKYIELCTRNKIDYRISPTPFTLEIFSQWLRDTDFMLLRDKSIKRKRRLYNRTGIYHTNPSCGMDGWPHIDRIDSMQGYLLQNMQVLAQEHNLHKRTKIVIGPKTQTMKFFKTLRQQLKLTRYEMAKKLDLLPQTYLYYENKAQGCGLHVICKVRKATGLSWDEIGKMLDKEYRDRK
jgi:DNA-binding XRE family transcriptional regulator